MIQKTKAGRAFDWFNVIFMILVMIITIYPFYYIIMCSISNPGNLVGDKGLMLKPLGFSLQSYKAVLENPNIFSGYKITIFIVIAGTSISVLMTSLGAFVLTRKQFALKRAMNYMIIITMYFSGGMIPTYMLVYKYLNLGNSLWALILPICISAYNLIVMRTNFQSIPDSLEEAAKIDGANDFVIFSKIVMPLSKAVIAVMVLFCGVSYWNSWFNAMLYIRDKDKFPLQLVLREILLLNSSSSMMDGTSDMEKFSLAEGIKYSSIIVATVPILCVYPFVQKYFVSGVMIGAVKG